MQDHSMENQVAVVTGAAGGIGSVICQRLANAGARIIIVDIGEIEQLQSFADSLDGEGHLVSQTFIDNSDNCKELASRLEKEVGAIDLLVNCAGITTPVEHDDLESLTDEWIDQIFRVNWRGAFAMIRALKPLLEKKESSTIVNISSIAGTTGVGSNVAYCASKAAIDSMTRSLGRALAPKIRVISVAPGWVLTDYARRFDPAYLQTQIDAAPLKRLATPKDVAETVWAVHAKLKMMTGNIVPVDGGRPLGA